VSPGSRKPSLLPVPEATIIVRTGELVFVPSKSDEERVDALSVQVQVPAESGPVDCRIAHRAAAVETDCPMAVNTMPEPGSGIGEVMLIGDRAHVVARVGL
jgi:hypothetical protein